MANAGLFWKSQYGQQVSADLSEQEKELRNLFVREYLMDYDEVAACIRCGFLDSYAQQYAQQFMNESYVLQQISEHTRKRVELLEDKTKINESKGQILASLFREANYRGAGSSHGARIAALAKLASLHGMDAATKVEQTINHRGGVMAVPGIASCATWEAQAMQSQEKLTGEAES